MTIVFITHDINLVKDYATHISIMQQGQLIESGEASSILANPHIAIRKFNCYRTSETGLCLKLKD